MLVAVIGLGQMGRAMATCLVEHGFELRVWNRSPAASAGLVGVTVCTSAAEAAQGSKFVVSSLSADEAVQEVLLEEGGLLAALPEDCVHIGTTTISHGFARELAKEHSRAQRAYLAAPVVGRPDAAAAGKLFILAGGDEPLRRRCRPVLEALGQRTFDFADAGRAHLAKILVNFMLAGNIELLGEVFALGEKGGIAPARAFEILSQTLFGSPAVEGYGRRIAEQQFEPAGMRMALGLKDVELALSAGHDMQVPLPTANVVRDHYLTALASGLENYDWSGLTEVVRSEAGLRN
jgi:3-hydroxyisobutyrate dehydrogenase-like beta-hydroxyacid dehydrogenase